MTLYGVHFKGCKLPCVVYPDLTSAKKRREYMLKVCKNTKEYEIIALHVYKSKKV